MHRVFARPAWCALERPVSCYGGALRPRARVWLAWSGRPDANRGTADRPARRASPAAQLRTFAAASLATQEPRRSKPGACALQARALRSVGSPRRQWLAYTRGVATCARTLAPLSSDWSEGTDEDEDDDDDDFASVTDPVQLLVEAEELADLRHPHKWYPAARDMKRRVVLHVGPTNSGKTYQALKALEAAECGLYLGPLRLLAWEVHQRLNEQGVPCNLLTGQEKEDVPHARHVSSTVEMADINNPVSVAVIDEIQMIGNEQRGWAWTRALLGVQADEIHVCGDDSAVNVVARLCDVTGDELEVKRYTRLSPLSVAKRPVKNLSRVRRGDCVVAFGRQALFKAKQYLERTTELKVGVIYGSLPPETRKEQARAFNDADGGTDVLVATDAVGMGLNLNIRRILFSAMEKFDGKRRRNLTVSEIKQIGGRAGRFGSEFPSGTVAVLASAQQHAGALARAIAKQTPQVRAAGLFPSSDQLELFARVFQRAVDVDSRRLIERREQLTPRRRRRRGRRGGKSYEEPAAATSPQVPFSELLALFVSHARIDRLYFMTDVAEMIQIAEVFDHVPLDIETRFIFCAAPVPSVKVLAALYRYAQRYACGEPVRVGLTPPSRVALTDKALKRLEEHHHIYDLYVWLARRFPNSFTDLEEAQARVAITQALIGESLERMAQKSGRKRERRAQRAERGANEGRGPRSKSGSDKAAALTEKARRLRALADAARDELSQDQRDILDARINLVAPPRANLHEQLEQHRKQAGLAPGSPEYLQSVRDMLQNVSLAELELGNDTREHDTSGDRLDVDKDGTR